MAHLSTPSPTLTPAGVGRNTSRGSWELTPPPNVLDGLDVDIDQEGQAILEDILPSTSRVTPVRPRPREFAACRDLMIRWLANGSIKQALCPHLQREHPKLPPMAVDPRPLCSMGRPGAAAGVAAVVVLHHLSLPLLHHPVVHRVVVEAVAVEAVGDTRVV